MNPRLRRCVMLCGGLALLTWAGCAQVDPLASKPDTPKLHYMAAKHVVQIEANLTQAADRHIDDDLTLDTQSRFVATQALVRLRVEPDTSQSFSLDLSALAQRQDDGTPLAPVHAVAVNGDGLLVTPLTGAGIQTPGGEVICDVAHFPQPANGAMEHSMPPATRPSEAVTQLFDKTETGKMLKGADHAAALQRFARLPRLLLWMLDESDESRELWDRRIKLDALLAGHIVDRDDLLDRMTQAKDNQGAESIKTRLEAVNTEIASLTKERDGVDAALQANLERLLSDRGVGAQQQTVRRSVTLQMVELPPSESLADCRTSSDVESALGAKYPRALEAFEQTRVLVTLNSVLNAQPATSEPRLNDNTLTLHYRPAQPATLTVWALAWRPDADEPVLVRVDQKSLSVLSTKTPLANFPLDPRTLVGSQVSFDALGRFTGIRGRFILDSRVPSPATSPQERVDRNLEVLQSLDVLKNQLSLLVRQKEVVDSQIALQGETTDPSLLSRQAHLRESILQLRARVDALAMNALGMQGESTTQQGDSQSLLSQLQAQIEGMKNQPQTAPATQP